MKRAALLSASLATVSALLLPGCSDVPPGQPGPFANGAVAVRPQKVRRLQSLNCAVHSVLERIEITTADGLQTAWVLATNVYLKSGGGWAMAAHHASPGSPREAQDIAEGPTTIH